MTLVLSIVTKSIFYGQYLISYCSCADHWVDTWIFRFFRWQHHTCFIGIGSHRNFDKIDRRQQKSGLTLEKV
jgi:hypothetical protein